MEGPEFIIAALAIICGTGLAGYIFMNIFKLIRSWVGGTSDVDEESFNRLAKAFMEHKKESERRLQNLEAIASDNDNESTSSSKQIEAPKQEITMDDEDADEQTSSTGDNNLRNMLRE
jgi:hypothetical protein